MRAFETFTNRNGLALDVFRPDAAGHRCAVLVLSVADGVSVRGIRASRCPAAQGFAAVAVQYRLLGAAPWPAQMEAAAAACAWVRGNADKLGIDPAKVAIQGHSARAHWALMTGTLEGDGYPSGDRRVLPTHRVP